jgi:PucR family transcriptional regulator, purine catabolism regulatory protein
VAITVAELVEVPFVKMRFHAGAAGGGRLVTWAHSSDLPNAVEWLAPGDLLMSNGQNVPVDAQRQVMFLQELVAAGLSGLAIGDEMHAPPLTPSFLARAERLAFPILAIPHEVPFVAISRAVASANSDEEHRRLVRTAQLYEIFQNGVSSGSLGRALLSELGEQLECRLLLLDTTSSLPVIPGDGIPSSLYARIVTELATRNGVFPGVLRVSQDGTPALVIRVPAGRPTALVALRETDQGPDLTLLQHAANIAALEVERISADRERRRRLGAETLAKLLEGQLEPGFAQRELREHELAADRAVLAAFRTNGDMRDEDLSHELIQRELAHVMHSDSDCVFVLLGGDGEALTVLRSALDETPVGLSDVLRRPDRAPDAAREAGWALAVAETLERPLVRYGQSTSLFLPRTLGEAEGAVKRVLGSLLAYDDEHATELLRSLRVFLEENRSWQRSAKRLHVHKQTLVYRIRRIEELTGRSLRDTADVVEFWMALEALQLTSERDDQCG